MNINDLKLFEAVAYYGNFTKAAAANFTVQSNVTARIKSLEEAFGATLLARSSRKVELTAAGKSLLRYSRQIINLLEEAKLSVGESRVLKGRLNVGFLETTMAHKGPGIVNEMAGKFPRIDLHLTSAMRDTLIDRVLSYKLDAAFIPAPIDNEELGQIPINDERIVAVTPRGVENLNDLLAHPHIKAIVFDQGCFFRARLEAWLISHGILNYHKTVMNSIEGVVNFIESGIGFSFLPEEIISTFYSARKVNVHALPKAIGVAKTVLVYRKDHLSSPLLKAFVGLFS